MTKKKVKYKYRLIPKERRSKLKNTKSRKYIPGLLVVLLLFTAGFLFIKSDYFTVKTIHVEGISRIERSEILNVSSIKKGKNIFDYNTSKEEEKIKALSLVESVEITRDLPSDVYIYVRERQNALCILLNGEYYYLDKDSLIIKKEPTITETGVILANIATGVENVNFEVGTTFDYSADGRLGVIKNVYDYISANELNAHISEIYISPTGINYLYTTKSNVLKFYTFTAFEQNKDFVKDFILYEDRHIMAEVIEDTRPVYKVIEIK